MQHSRRALQNTVLVLRKCSARRRGSCALRNSCIGFSMRPGISDDWIDSVMCIFGAGSCIEKRPWLVILQSSGCMGMRSRWNTRKLHLLSIPFAINRIKSTSKRCQRPDDLKPPTVHCKGGCGNWMRPCGIWLRGSPTTRVERNPEKRPCWYNYHSWKTHQWIRSNASAVQSPCRQHWQKACSLSADEVCQNRWFDETSLFEQHS